MYLTKHMYASECVRAFVTVRCGVFGSARERSALWFQSELGNVGSNIVKLNLCVRVLVCNIISRTVSAFVVEVILGKRIGENSFVVATRFRF